MKSISSIAFLDLFIVIVLLFPSEKSLKADEIQWTAREKEWLSLHKSTVRIGIHEYPPLVIKNSKNKNKYEGISIDFIGILEKRLGITFQLIEIDSWTELLENIKNEKLDVVFAIQQTKERESFLLFTSPYLSIGTQIVARKGVKIPESLSKLSGKKAAMVENSAVYYYIEEHYPGLRIVPVKDELSALAEVSAGDADISIGEMSRISYYFQKELFSNLKIVGPIDFTYDFRFGIRKELEPLRNIIEKALGNINTEERSLLLKNYIHVYEKKIYEELDFLIGLGIATALLVILIILNWNRSLNKLVESRTLLYKKSEEKERIAKEEARSANKAKSEFLSNMSHEIRTPLNGVIGFTDLLMKTELDATQMQYMEIVNQSANSLLDLLNDILDFSKIEAGKLELSFEKVDIWALVEQASDVIKHNVQQKNLKVLLNIAPEIRQYIYTDPIRLRQIIINLLGNAAKFTEEGEIEIKIELSKVDSTEKVKRYIFSIRDTGIGISLEHQQGIFAAFSQEDASITRKYGGIGLGLTISNKLLALLNSRLQLESEPGKGSKFYFTLIAKPGDREEDPEKNSDSSTDSPELISTHIEENPSGNNHFNLNKLKSSLKLNDEFLFEFLFSVNDSLASFLIELKGFWKDKNLEGIHATAHKIKGTALTIYCAELTNLAASLEKQEQFDQKAISDVVQKIEIEIDLLKTLISRKRNDLNSDKSKT